MCIGCDFCEFQVKPMLQLTCGQFCSISTLGMGPRCLSVAVSTWLVATCLLHKVQGGSNTSCGVCTYNLGNAGCSG